MEAVINDKKPHSPFFQRHNTIFKINIRSAEKSAENLENRLKKLILREAESEANFDNEE